jgi:hypothetical protein
MVKFFQLFHKVLGNKPTDSLNRCKKHLTSVHDSFE